MKKTMIALMLSSLSFAAFADVTLYGEIKGGLDYTKQKGADNTVTTISDWGSRIGFKGTEELGDGLKAIWQIEQYVSLDSKAQVNHSWADRLSFLGLETGIGTFRIGHLEDSIKSLEDIVDPWDGIGIRTLGYYDRTGTYLTSARYDSPDFGGFSFNVVYSPEDNSRYNQIRSEGIVDDLSGFEAIAPDLNIYSRYSDTISAGFGYELNGFFGKYAYKNVKLKTGSGEDNDTLNAQVHRVLLGYDANKIYTVFGYQHTKDFGNNDRKKNLKTDEETITVSYDFGNVTPRISWVHGEEKFDDVSSLKEKYDQFIIGADYAFSKRTTALISAGWLKNKKGNDNGLNNATRNLAFNSTKDRIEAYTVGFGLRHKF